MRLKIELGAETMRRLARAAERERRPIPWQAETMLERALGMGTDREILTPHPPSQPAPVGESEAQR
jgi:hypothetical protein